MRALRVNETNNTAYNVFSQIHLGIEDKNESDNGKKTLFYVFLQTHDPSFKVNVSRYIALFVVNGSIKKLFSID